MIKIVNKLLLLALCLNLVCGIASANPRENAGLLNPTQNQTEKTDVVSDVGTGDSESVLKGQYTNNIDTKAYLEKKKSPPPQRELVQPSPKQNDEKDDGFFGIILTALEVVLGLLVIYCLVAIFKIDGRLKKLEKKSKDSDSFKSEGFDNLNTKISNNYILPAKEESAELKEIKNRLSKLETAVHDLQLMMIKMKRENQPKDQPTETPQLSSRNDSNRLMQIKQQLNKDILTDTNTPVQLPVKKIESQWSAKSREIAVAFNEMMRETAKTTGWDTMTIREKFMKDYRVTAFKCVNSLERVNNPEEKPRFASCPPSESSLWGVPLPDGTLVILPSPREYESTAHKYGGLKELFTSDYSSGTYRKIEVREPAIVTRDFQINQKGRLRLSH